MVRWREQAELLRAHGAAEAAATKLRDASELEAWLGAYTEQRLTLAQAAAESGFSASHLRRLVALHVLPNAGQNGELRLRRGDLPRKPGRVAGPNLAATVLGLSQ